MELLKNQIKKTASYFRLLKLYLSDFKYNFKHNNGYYRKPTKSMFETRMLLIIHQLEKGMTHESKGRVFGGDKAYNLAKLISDYCSKYEIDNIVILAVNTLAKYIELPNSTLDAKLRNFIEAAIQNHKKLLKPNHQGIKIITEQKFDTAAIEAFFKSRGSVREFSNAPITDSELKRIYEFASYAPSACNRQSCKVYHFPNRKQIDEIIENQLGDQGWCKNATSLFVITSNAEYFNEGYERLQPYIDGGIFSMNFIMGLHANGIASCFKMYVREPKIDKKFRKITNIPECEVPIIVIMAGHYPDQPHISTKSERFIQEV